jgi:CBS domain-containing protein
MAKRQRRPIDQGDFEDPLKNYDSIDVDDFEIALLEEQVSAIETKPFVTVDVATPMAEIVAQMAEKGIGCVLVTDNDQLAGIFTQRDLLNKVAERYEQVKDTPVSELMSPDPVAIHEIESPAVAINLMSVGGFRHIPVLDVDDHLIGLVGPRRTTKYLKKYFPAVS